MARNKFILASVYDTETTNILDEESKMLGNVENTRAFPILFIDNDIRDVDLKNYKPDVDDKISFYRTENEMQARIDEYIEWGLVCKKVPIICAYNLMFDLHPLMEGLNARYDIQANAQSSTNVYTLDLYEQDTQHLLLRFWDTFHLEMRGLAAMGRTCGFSKAVGDWDYSLVRTSETTISDLELFYARRDVQVIPAYLQYLLRANEWMQQTDFGFRVLTKTSIVRQMAKREIGPKKIREKEDGKCLTLRKAFMRICSQELPPSYGSYALRKACFRGGYTFTSAAMSMRVVRNVASVDVTSMHHTFINGRKIPVGFAPCSQGTLSHMCETVCNTSISRVMERYYQPLDFAFHARIRIGGIRLKKGSCFERWGIGLLAQSKFATKTSLGAEFEEDVLQQTAYDEVMAHGFHDRFSDDAVFAFGKLYSATEIVVHVTELELWCMSRVYEWDSLSVIGGEATAQWVMPPDYVTAQSNMLYKQKDLAKFIANHYVEGEPYPYSTNGIPDGIAASLKDGSCEWAFFNSWYTGTVKGMFNGIYGTMAQDQFKPNYTCVGGELVVDRNTICRPENFEEKEPKSSMVLYTYGMRIVGGSRMHMVIAMELVHDFFGSRVDVLGGDTDSMKLRLDFDVTDEELLESLEPIAKCSKEAIDFAMQRLRRACPEFASPLTGIGSFEVENAGNHYDYHIELWNKCRLSVDKQKRAHITCAGLSRPSGAYHIETFINDCCSKYPVAEVLEKCIGFNTYVSHEISHSLEAHHPKVSDRYVGPVTDYKGETSYVDAHESTSLYPVGRWLGETLKVGNAYTLAFLRDRYGRKLDSRNRYLCLEGNKAILRRDSALGATNELEVSLCGK